MKTLKIYATILAAALLAACGGGSDGPAEPATRTFTKALTIPSDAGTQTISLDQFSVVVFDVKGTTEWFQVVPEPYTSGAPKFIVSWSENKAITERKCNVTFTASTGDKLVLNVTQEAHEPYDIDEPNNTPTDGPAYAPRR